MQQSESLEKSTAATSNNENDLIKKWKFLGSFAIVRLIKGHGVLTVLGFALYAFYDGQFTFSLTSETSEIARPILRKEKKYQD